MTLSVRISEIDVETHDGKFATFSIGECGVFVPLEDMESGQATRDHVRAFVTAMAEHYLDLPDDTEIDGEITLAEMKRSIREQIVKEEVQEPTEV